MQRTLLDPALNIPALRLFFALWPDPSTRRQLAQWRDVLQQQTGGRPMDTADLHLTLAFIGDVTADMRGPIIAATEMVAACAFTLVIDRPDYWRHNRIVWAGCASTPAALNETANAIRQALARAGIRFDDKKFVPHITLLRDAPRDFELAALEPIEWQIERFVLLQSVQGQKPRYEVLKAWTARPT